MLGAIRTETFGIEPSLCKDRQCLKRSHSGRAWGQRAKHGLAVGLGDEAFVENRNYTKVFLAAYEPAESLAEAQDRLGQIVLVERVLKGL